MLRVEVVCGGQNAELRHLTSDINITREDNPHFYKIKLTRSQILLRLSKILTSVIPSQTLEHLPAKSQKFIV